MKRKRATNKPRLINPIEEHHAACIVELSVWAKEDKSRCDFIALLADYFDGNECVLIVRAVNESKLLGK